MALTVTAGDLEALRFCESDEARSIVQNIAVILTTAKGTAPAGGPGADDRGGAGGRGDL